MEWKDLELSDKNWIVPLLKASGYQGCEYTFGNLFIWKDLYRQQVAQAEGMLFVRSRKPGTGEYAYLYPAGTGDVKSAVSLFSKQEILENLQSERQMFPTKEQRGIHS